MPMDLEDEFGSRQGSGGSRSFPNEVGTRERPGKLLVREMVGRLAASCEARVGFDMLYRRIAIAQMEFIEDIVDMVFDGGNFDVQVNRDLLVRQSLVDQSHDFRFTFCETGSLADLSALDLACERGNSIEGQTRNSWGAQRLSVHDGPDVADEIVKG